MARPSFSGAWTAFAAVRGAVADVGKKIGGTVQKNLDAKIFQNAYPKRGRSNARGHVTLRDGTKSSDTCHLLNDPDIGLFAPETASTWVQQ